jgi:ribulose 1,5-bisphosphate synthetase/thiazole synthase
MSRRLLVSAALGVFGSLLWLSSATADPLDEMPLQQQTVLNGQTVWNASQEPTPFRVAVIGAGAAGSSAAWWLHLASDRLRQPIHVEVFERAPYVGGRR